MTVETLREAAATRDPEALLTIVASEYAGSIAFASSLGAEDQVITHMIATLGLAIPVFTLDTGRMFSESYDLIERTRAELGIAITPYLPDAQRVQDMVREHGVNLFYRSVELRRACCHVRKVEPLRRALVGRKAWVTGLRRAQSVTRATLEPVEWDEANGLVKISPLAAWSEDQVWHYVREHGIPYHPLHDQGFPSIGCEPCTRAVQPGADPRSGRWWWEHPEHRECGLHTTRPGQAVFTPARVRARGDESSTVEAADPQADASD